MNGSNSPQIFQGVPRKLDDMIIVSTNEANANLHCDDLEKDLKMVQH